MRNCLPAKSSVVTLSVEDQIQKRECLEGEIVVFQQKIESLQEYQGKLGLTIFVF